MTTVSPGCTRSAGGCWPMVLKNRSGSKRCVVTRFPPEKAKRVGLALSHLAMRHGRASQSIMHLSRYCDIMSLVGSGIIEEVCHDDASQPVPSRGWRPECPLRALLRRRGPRWASVTRRPMRPARTCSSSTAPSVGTAGSASVSPDAPRSGGPALLPLDLISGELRPGAFSFPAPRSLPSTIAIMASTSPSRAFDPDHVSDTRQS